MELFSWPFPASVLLDLARWSAMAACCVGTSAGDPVLLSAPGGGPCWLLARLRVTLLGGVVMAASEAAATAVLDEGRLGWLPPCTGPAEEALEGGWRS